MQAQHATQPADLAASTDSLRVRVAVLGAGLSGVCMGVRLRQHGETDFVLLEKAQAVGGTWRENTYPGVACDVPSHLYSFSFELNPDWSQAFSPGSEIQGYCARTADKYGVTPHIRFGQEVQDVRFEDGLWHVRTAAGLHVVADVVVSALGGLHVPNRAQVPGIETFAGPRFHTAQWDHGVDLAGKRVAIIGTGASAAQVLPRIAPDVAAATVFQRHAAWVFPRMANAIPEARRALFRRSPWRMRMHRRLLWTLMDITGVLSLRRGSGMNEKLTAVALDYLARAVKDPETRRKLTPDYAAGCKRRVVSDDYLQAFDRDNVHLVTDAITGVEPEGVRDAAGVLHPVDVIIEATGFKPFNITDYVEIRGRDGLRLADAWRDRVRSLRTMMMPGFPNFFFLVGPNSGTGHTSILIMTESQADYVLQCLDMLKRDGARLVEPTEEATEAFTARMQRDMRPMVFGGGCDAWYTDANDYNYTLWPHSAFRFVFELAKPLRRELRLE